MVEQFYILILIYNLSQYKYINTPNVASTGCLKINGLVTCVLFLNTKRLIPVYQTAHFFYKTPCRKVRSTW